MWRCLNRLCSGVPRTKTELKKWGFTHRRSQGWQGACPLSEMLPMIKMSHKRLLFLVFQFLLATLRTTVISNNVDLGALVPLNLMFAKQFKWAPYNNI